VQFIKNGFHSETGQYVWICCPEISVFEWHPFTLTSSPYDGFLSIHIRVVGDWTTAFGNRVGCNFDNNLGNPRQSLPYILVDGGYGNCSKQLFNYETIFLVGAGIGMAPYASILKSLKSIQQTNLDTMKLKKVYFYWICRDKQAIQWFQDVLLSLEDGPNNSFFDIRIFLTQPLKSTETDNLVDDGLDLGEAMKVKSFLS
jgi:predicted ferric reductase